jgi:hypothetical protein
MGEINAYKFWSENVKGKDHSEDITILAKDHRKTGWEGVDWMHLAQDRNQ